MSIQFVAIFLIVMLSACGGGSSGGGSAFSSNSSKWLVPESQVRDGGPGPDGIPSIDNPRFLTAGQAISIPDEQLVVGVRIGDETRAYPHNILDWHEIVNDEFLGGSDSQKVILSYCPLTGSSLLWKAFSNSNNPTFGTSGLLYNSNLILYDRETNSLWAQMLQQSVNGLEISRVPEKLQAIETTWATWKAMYPSTLVLSEVTGFTRNYANYPYGSFRTNTDLLFSVSNFDTRLHPKERVVGVRVDDVSKVYQINSFAGSVEVLNDRVNEFSIVVIGSSKDNFGVIYSRVLNDGTILDLSSVEGELPVVMEDSEGNQWDIFGRSVSGARTGEQLGKTDSFIAYWFAWGTFFPNANIHF